METNIPMDSMFEVGYSTAVKDIASLMGFDPDEYGYNR